MEVTYVTFFILILTKHNLHAATHLLLITTVGKIYLHFTDKETERQSHLSTAENWQSQGPILGSLAPDLALGCVSHQQGKSRNTSVYEIYNML